VTTDDTARTSRGRRLPVLQGLLPLERSRIPMDVVAGVTLAALAIPEVMGYTSIAGMPVITGLYTIVLPMLAFAVFGSSRHLVVGADSATAAVLAAGLAGLAVRESDQYVALAGLVALMAAVFLIVARIIGLGFLADFLSRTVLIGFLTGVGVQVAFGQVGGMLGIPEGKGVTIAGHLFGGTIGKLVSTLGGIGAVSWTTTAVSAAVIAVILGMKFVTRQIPGALVAVIGSILVSWLWDLGAHGVATLGPVPGGLPHLGLPHVGWADIPALMGTTVSIFVLILAQSAATSRAYAARYEDRFDENVDLVGLGVANVMAGLSGTFVVNGSPTKTQMVDGAGGRSQLAQVTTTAIVAIVLLFLTAPLAYMPSAVLASVVFVIGVELIDIRGMRRILVQRRSEFVVAALTGIVVVILGVEQGIVIAIVASVVDHLRRSYRPPTAVLQQTPGDTEDGGWRSLPPDPATRTAPGIVVYRFAAPLYYANAAHFTREMLGFAAAADVAPLRCVCLDAAAIPDVDMSGAAALRTVHSDLSGLGVRLVLAEVMSQVRDQLDRYGLVDALGADAFYPTVSAAAAAAAAPGPGRQ